MSRSLAAVYTDALPEALQEAILGEAQALAAQPNFWAPQERVVGAAPGPSPAVEHAICLVHARLMRHTLGPDAWAGVEWWVQVYEEGKGLQFHFDKDEHLWEAQQRMVHPLLSCVLYLTGSPGEARQAPTVVLEQRFDERAGGASATPSTRTALVYPRAGQLAVFRGCLGHGVLRSCSTAQRVTLLLNWWRQKPQAVNEPPQDLPLARAPAEAPAGPVPLPRLKPCPTPCIRVPPDTEAGVITVDDLLEAFGVVVEGPGAGSAVELVHPGYELYPLGDARGEVIAGLATAAALVPLEQLQAIAEGEEGAAAEE